MLGAPNALLTLLGSPATHSTPLQPQLLVTLGPCLMENFYTKMTVVSGRDRLSPGSECLAAVLAAISRTTRCPLALRMRPPPSPPPPPPPRRCWDSPATGKVFLPAPPVQSHPFLLLVPLKPGHPLNLSILPTLNLHIPVNFV